MNNEIIILSDEKNKDTREKLESLKVVNSDVFRNSGYQYNPFITYILEKDCVREDICDLLYHTEFLESMTDTLFEAAKELFDCFASIDWFNAILRLYQGENQPVMDDDKDETGEKEKKPYIAEENRDPFCNVFMKGFRNDIPIFEMEKMFDTNNTPDSMEKEVEAYIAVHSEDARCEENDNRRNLIDIQRYQKIYDRQDTEISRRDEEIQRITKENDRLNCELERLQLNIEAAANKSNSVEKLLMDERMKNDNLLQMDQRLKDMLKASSDSLMNYVQKISSLEERIVALRDDNDAIEKRVREEMSASSERTVSELRKSFESVISNKEEEIRRKEEAYSSVFNDNLSMKETIESLSEKNQLLSDEKQSLMDKLDVRESNNDKLLEENNDLKGEISNRDDLISSLSEEIESLKLQLSSRAVSQIQTADFEADPQNDSEQSSIDPVQEDYLNMDFTYSEPEESQEESEDAGKLLGISTFDVKPIEKNKERIKKKTSWFKRFLLDHSEKVFCRRSFEDQKSEVLKKMMTLDLFLKDGTRKIRENTDETIPMFDLYKMINKDTTDDDITLYFESHGIKILDESNVA